MEPKRRNGLLQKRLHGHSCGIIARAMWGLRVRLGDTLLLQCFAAPSPLQLLALQRAVCKTLLARVFTTTWSKCSRRSGITLGPSKIKTWSQSSTRTLNCALPRCRSSEKRCRTYRSTPTRRDHREEVERPERFFWDSRGPTSAPGTWCSQRRR